VTEHGHAVFPAELACLLIDMNRHEFRRTDVGVTKRLHPELDSWLNHYGVVCDSSHESPTQLALSLSGSPTKLGFDENGRVWFNETVPTCDVFLTLARMLQALSLSDAPLSEVIRKKAGLLKSGTSLPS
jgi:phosphomannomutase